MIVELGKHYQTRSGYKVRVLAIDPEIGVVGAVIVLAPLNTNLPNHHTVMEWRRDGRVRSGFESSLDLVEEVCVNCGKCPHKRESQNGRITPRTATASGRPGVPGNGKATE